MERRKWKLESRAFKSAKKGGHLDPACAGAHQAGWLKGYRAGTRGKRKRQIFKLGYYTYEESEYWELYAPKYLTKKEFNTLVKSTFVEVIKKKENSSYCFWVDYLFPLVIEKLKKRGFKEVEYDGTFELFGWNNFEEIISRSNKQRILG